MKYYRTKALCLRSLVKAAPFAVLLTSLVLSGCPSRHAAELGIAPEPAKDYDFPVSTLLPLYDSSVISQNVAVGYGLAAAGAHAAVGEVSPSPFGSRFASAPTAMRGVPGSVTKASSLDGVQRVSLVDMTLRDAVGLAIAHHPDVSRAEAVVNQSAAEVSVAKGAWFPVLNYNVAPGYGSAYSRDSASGAQISGGISQLVYDFGKTPGRISQADAALNRERHTLNNTIEDVAYSAANHYVQFSAAQATMDAAQEAIANLNKLRRVIADRVRASLSAASDLTQADVALQRATVDLVQAKTRLNVAADNLAEIIGMRPQSVADLASVNKVVVALSNGDENIERAPAVQAAKAAILEAEAQIKIMQSDYFPSLNLVGNKNTMTGGDSGYNTDWAGLSVSGSFSSVGQNRHRVAAARANRDAMVRQLESQRLLRRTELVSAGTEIEGAAVRRQALDTMKKLSLTSRDLYWQEYTLGKRQLTNVLDAERDIFSAESSRITAIADGLTARLKAENAVGSLVNELRRSRM